MSKSTQSTDPVKPFMLTTDRTDPLAHLPWRFRPLARFMAKANWTPLDVARIEKANNRLGLDWDDPANEEARELSCQLEEQIEDYRKLSDRWHWRDLDPAPVVSVKVAAMAPVATPKTKPAKAPRKPTRSADSIILDGIAAYRAETEAGEGRGHLGVYAAERIYDSLTGGQRSALTRKLNTIGFDDGSGNRPNSRFISFAGQCVYGVELPEETPSEGFPATPPMGFSELVAERKAIASEIVAAILEVIPSKDEEIDSIARRHARGIAYAARLRREAEEVWRAETSDRLFWFSLGQQARDDYNRFLDLMGIVHEWSEEDGDYEPDSWRYARFIGMCVTGSPVCLPSHFPIPPDDFDLAEDDAQLDFAPSWAEYCQGAMVTWPATPVPSFLEDDRCWNLDTAPTAKNNSTATTMSPDAQPAALMDARTASTKTMTANASVNCVPKRLTQTPPTSPSTIVIDGTTYPVPSFLGENRCRSPRDPMTAITTTPTMTRATRSATDAENPQPTRPDGATGDGLSDARSTPERSSRPALASSEPWNDCCSIIIEGVIYRYLIGDDGIILTHPDGRDHVIIDGACSCPDHHYRERECKHLKACRAGGLLPADTPSGGFPEPTPEDWDDIYRGRDEIDDDHDTPSGVWDRPDDFPEDHTTMAPEEARELLASHGLAPISGGAPEDNPADDEPDSRTESEWEADQARYTPGEWEFRETDEGHEIRMGSALKSYGGYEPQHVINYDHECLADDDTEEDFSDPSPETRQYFEAQANARLIAAAPDLLEALIDFYALHAESDWRVPDEKYGVVTRAAAAIAKATGR